MINVGALGQLCGVALWIYLLIKLIRYIIKKIKGRKDGKEVQNV